MRVSNRIHHEAHPFGRGHETGDGSLVCRTLDLEPGLHVGESAFDVIGSDGTRLHEARRDREVDLIEGDFSCFADPSELRK